MNPPTHAQRRPSLWWNYPAEEEITVEEVIAKINRAERMGLETGGAGALGCIPLGRNEGGGGVVWREIVC